MPIFQCSKRITNLQNLVFHKVHFFVLIKFFIFIKILNNIYILRKENITMQILNKIKTHTTLIFYIYALVLFLLNFIRIFDNAFWGDEGFSIKLAKMFFSEMIDATAKDVHPPLYYMFAQLLYRIFGNEGFSYHLSSIIPYAIIMIIACTYVKYKFGYISTLVLITLSSLTSSALIYNVEVRMYAMGAMFVIISFLSLYEILKYNKNKAWIIFIVSSLCAAYTHYYALISVAFFYLVMLLLAYSKRNYLKTTCIACLITIIAYFPWLIILLKAFERTAKNWWLKDIPSLSNCLKFIFAYNWISIIFIIFTLIFFLYQIKGFHLTKSNNQNFLIKFDFHFGIPKKITFSKEFIWIFAGIFSIFGTIAIGLTLSHLIRPFLVTRYLFPLSAMAYLILGYCISNLKYKRTWSILLIIAFLASAIPNYLNTYKNERTLNKSTIEFLTKVNPTENAIIYTNNSHLGWTLLEYYYPEAKGFYKPKAFENLNITNHEIWFFWTKEFDEKIIQSINKQKYSCKQIHIGRFANGAKYYVYKLTKEVH